MNRRTEGLKLSQAIDGFVKYKVVEGLSERTLESYLDHLNRLKSRCGNINVNEVTVAEIEDFLFWLRTDYSPQRLHGKQKPLSNKTIYNIWVTLKSFFSWAEGRRFVAENPMSAVPRPKFQEKPVEPFTREEIERILKACKYSAVAKTSGRRPFRMQRPTYRRDRALTMFLLDTGLRASEIYALHVGDVDLKTGEVNVRHGKDSGAKGGKGRTVYIGKGTRRTLWRYLVEREDGEAGRAPLFATIDGRWLNRDSLRLLFRRLGEQAEVKKCHPHRFRHTFAISYLRLHGDVLTLQALLGHTSLEMVKRYARIAQIDLQRSHSQASPVDRWKL